MRKRTMLGTTFTLDKPRITFQNMPRLIGGAAVLAAAAIGLGPGVAPASAAPAQSPGTNLYVYKDPASSGNYRVTVKGVIPMNEYDAHGFINNINTGERPGGIEYNLIGDDDSNDHGLDGGHWFPGAGRGPGPGYLVAESDGIHFLREIVVPFNTLNEDDGVFDDGDEVYAYVRFVDADGGVRRLYTNKVSGMFGGNY
jgi:hypothetical protein